MRAALMLTTAMSLVLASPAYPDTATISPGGGSIADASGNVWAITASGSITENGAYTAGGGGTSSLEIASNGTVYGLDASGRGWFTLSGNYWTASPPPSAASVASSSSVPVAVSPSTPTSATPSACSTSGVTSSGQFGELNGQIYGPNQAVFVPRGINVMEQNFNTTTAAQILQQFPGINFIRVPIYNLSDNPAQFAATVQMLSAKGVVVEFEDHTTSTGSDAGGGNAGGAVFTGQMLANEQAFYSSFASYYKNNTNVWFGTNNEPPDANLAALGAWQEQTYNTIRATGDTSMVELEVSGYNAATFNAGLPAADYASMTNTMIDLHEYSGNISNGQTIAGNVAGAQKLTNAAGIMPVMIGEYGNSQDGNNVDAAGNQLVQDVQAEASAGVGSAAWMYSQGNADALQSGNGLSAFGQSVASFIASATSAPAVTASTSCTTAAPVAVSAATSLSDTAMVVAPAIQAPTIIPTSNPPLNYLSDPAWWASNPSAQAAEVALCASAQTAASASWMTYCAAAGAQ